MRLLGLLGLVEIRTRQEVGTRVLFIGVEEEIVDGAVDIVVVGDITLATPGWIELLDSAQPESETIEQPEPLGRLVRIEIAHRQVQEFIEITLLDQQATAHIGFTDRQLRIERDSTLGRFVGKANDDLSTGPIAKNVVLSIGVDDSEVAFGDDPAEYEFQRPEHGGTPRRLQTFDSS